MNMKTDQYNSIDQANIYRNNKTQMVNDLRINENYMLSKMFHNLKDLEKTFYGETIDAYLKSNMAMISK